MRVLRKPYVLYLGDAVLKSDCKTAFGLRDWAPERCLGEWACPGASVSTGLPWLTPAQAHAKGARPGRVLFHHALRNSLIPVVTVIGFQIGGLLGGAAVVEIIFGLPGMGYTLVEGIYNRDYPVIQAAALLLAAVFVVLNLIVDLLYAVVDPRIGIA